MTRDECGTATTDNRAVDILCAGCLLLKDRFFTIPVGVDILLFHTDVIIFSTSSQLRIIILDPISEMSDVQDHDEDNI